MTWFTIVKNAKKDAVKDAEAFWSDYKEKTIGKLTHSRDILGTGTEEDYTNKDRKMIQRAQNKLNDMILHFTVGFETMEKRPIKERLIWLRDSFSPSEFLLSLFGLDKDSVLDKEELNKHIDNLQEWENYWG